MLKESNDPLVRLDLCVTLGELGQVSAIDELLDVHANDPFPNVRWEAALALLKCYNLGRDEIKRRGLVGREWLKSDEARMTASGMGENFIDQLNVLFDKWEPIEKYVIEKVEDKKTSYNPNAVQYTADFKQKVKEVLA